MAKVTPTLKVLMEIRDVLKQHDVRLENIERRQTESKIRLASELVNVAHAITEVRDLLRDRLDDRDRIDALDRRVSVLERRAPAE